jgi:hypothetical protein
MAGRRPSISNTEPRLGGVRISTSLYGQTIPVVLGRTKIPGNLLWYGGFKAVRQEERAEAAKGGGRPSGRSYYVYSASAAMLLCEGPIGGVRTVWKGKQQFGGQAATTRRGTAWHEAVVPGSPPYTVTVPTPSQWSADNGVMLAPNPEAFPATPQPLSVGIDYTAAAGVYTFDASRANAPVVISYTTSQAVASVDALAQLGLTAAPGTPGQPVWQYLATNFPAEAVPYAGLAYVRGQDYPLSDAAEVENHQFEVDGFLATEANGDTRPHLAIEQILTNPRWGAGWSAGTLEDWASYVNYCSAYGLVISLPMLEQRPARQWVEELLDATNTDAAWTGSRLRLIPRGDENAGSYVAPITPVFDLGPDDFLPGDGPPVQMERNEVSDELAGSGASDDPPNRMRAEFVNRGDPAAPKYTIEVVTADDEASIIEQGVRSEQSLSWHFFTSGDVCRRALQLRLQRRRRVRARYRFGLPWRFAELEIGDLITLTEPTLMLSKLPARVLSIDEQGDDFDVVVEEFPIGHATAPIVPSQLGSGFQPNFNAPPGSVAAPVIFEPPGGYTQNGLEVWAAISGPAGAGGQFWGGAEVYASLDGGSSYKLVGRVDQGARYGTLSQALSSTPGSPAFVSLAGRGGQLRAVSEAEADARATLMYVGDAATGEFIAYQGAVLTGANAYTLSALRRGLFNTAVATWASGTPFVYIDGALAISGPLPDSMIGRTIRFKFCSFNVFGGGLQSLDEVTEYSYVVTGRYRDRAAAVVSANWIENATCVNSTDGWVIGSGQSANIFLRHTSVSTGLPAQYVLSGTPADKGSGFFIQELGDRPANGLSDVWAGQPGKVYPVIPGDRIEGSVYLCTHRCTADVRVAYYRVDGSYVTEHVLWGPGAVNDGSWLQSLSQYGRRGGFSTAPANAARAMLFVRKYGRNGGVVADNSYVFCNSLYMGPALPGQAELSPFSDGPLRSVGTSDLVRGATGTDWWRDATAELALPLNRCDTALVSATLAEVGAVEGDTVVYRVTGTLTCTDLARVALTPTLFTDQFGQPKRSSEWATLPAGGDQPFIVEGSFVVPAPGGKAAPTMAFFASTRSGAGTLHRARLLIQLRRR